MMSSPAPGLALIGGMFFKTVTLPFVSVSGR